LSKAARTSPSAWRAGQKRLRALEARCRSLTRETRRAQRLFEDQFRRTQRTEATARLARSVAHDFNNVLAAILGSGDLLALALKPGDPGRDEVEEIQKAAERGATLTRQFIMFSRSQTFEAQRLDVNAIVRQTRPMLQRLAGERIDVAVRTAEAPMLVRAEPGQLEQVLLNLVVNARDAMPKGGTIDLAIDTITLDEQTTARYSGMPPGRYARVAVRDTGAGIDPGLQPNPFDQLLAAEDSARGARLGLWVVYGIAKDARGTAVVMSAPGRGTTVEVVLPLAID
jgi:two-component system cell cycle sensor histidine kinase/response regulator CckA